MLCCWCCCSRCLNKAPLNITLTLLILIIYVSAVTEIVCNFLEEVEYLILGIKLLVMLHLFSATITSISLFSLLDYLMVCSQSRNNLKGHKICLYLCKYSYNFIDHFFFCHCSINKKITRNKDRCAFQWEWFSTSIQCRSQIIAF